MTLHLVVGGVVVVVVVMSRGMCKTHSEPLLLRGCSDCVCGRVQESMYVNECIWAFKACSQIGVYII